MSKPSLCPSLDILSEYRTDRRFTTLHKISLTLEYADERRSYLNLVRDVEAEFKEKLGVADPAKDLRKDFRTIAEIQGNVEPWERVVAGRRFRTALAVYLFHYDRIGDNMDELKTFFRNHSASPEVVKKLCGVVDTARQSLSEVGGEVEVAKPLLEGLSQIYYNLDNSDERDQLVKWCQIVINVGGDSSLECEFPERLPLLRSSEEEEDGGEEDGEEEKKYELIYDGVYVLGLIRAVEMMKNCMFFVYCLFGDLYSAVDKLPLEEQEAVRLTYEKYKRTYGEIVELHCIDTQPGGRKADVFKELTPSLRESLEEIHQFDGEFKQLTLPGTEYFCQLWTQFCESRNSNEAEELMEEDLYRLCGEAKFVSWRLKQ